MSAQRRTTVEDDSAPVAPRPPRDTKTSRTAAARAEAAKTESASQPSLFATRTASLRELYRDTMSEMRKITWPDQETTRNLTVVVIGISITLGILLGGIDFLLVKLLELF